MNTGIKTKALIVQKGNYDNYNQEIEYLEITEKEVKIIGIQKLNVDYQFNFQKEEIKIIYDQSIEIKTLGELFKLNGNGKTNSSIITNSGEYPFYSASVNNPTGTHNNYDFDGNEYLLIVKSGGSASNPFSLNYGIGKVFLVKDKCAANIAVFQLLPIFKNNLLKYFYYYLKYNQINIQKLAKYCVNNGNIDMIDLMNLKIPIPSIEKQKEIVEYLDLNNDNIRILEKEIEFNKKQSEEFIKKCFNLI